MIHVKDITLFDTAAQVKLTSIRGAYYWKVTTSAKASPLREIEAAIALPGVDSTEKAFLLWIKKRYRTLLVGLPSRLVELSEEVQSNGWETLLRVDDKLTPFGEEVEKIFGYERSRFKPVRKWLAEQLNIKSCPYCNAQYTLVVNDSDEKTVVKFQFDHFFPKKRYPYLSISLYNLIPACASCNLAKSDGDTALDTHYHPYHTALAASARFTVKWNKGNVLSSFTEMQKLKPGDIDVAFVSKYADKLAMIEAHDKMFDITGVYKRHTDVVKELLEKAALYTEHYKESLDSIDGLFPNRKVMMRYILGNYMEEERILDRPLAKFTQDIAKSLNLIDE